MKMSQLMILAKATEIALPYLGPEFKEETEAALEAAFLEIGKRLKARDLYRASRPSRTVRREAIREQLALQYNKVRLTRDGEWHVQTAPGAAWMLFALSDRDAENLLELSESMESMRQACGCRQKHSDAAGVIEACRLGQEQGQDELWTGY
ncbi:MAG: hypothetical protein K8F91_22690 [Candidatus Obscuribacterales bacterium]|nr:hypothetical protein [Candidatus Obscuribacterales bacterium]